MRDKHENLEPEFRPGDLFEVVAWDNGEDRWEYGTIMLTDRYMENPYKGQWSYGVEPISGTITWSAVGMAHFQGIKVSLQKKYIGNIYDNPTLRVLYGKSY